MAAEKAKYVKVKLPKPTDGEEKDLFVGLNGVGYRIKKGVEVEVPAGVAEIIRHASEANDALDAFIEECDKE